jgi:hypothetical protein
VTSENGTRRPSPHLRRQQGETYHRAARRTKKKLWERQYYEALLRMDELTKYHRVAKAVSRATSRTIFELTADRCRCECVDIHRGILKSTNPCLEQDRTRRAKHSLDDDVFEQSFHLLLASQRVKAFGCYQCCLPLTAKFHHLLAGTSILRAERKGQRCCLCLTYRRCGKCKFGNRVRTRPKIVQSMM